MGCLWQQNDLQRGRRLRLIVRDRPTPTDQQRLLDDRMASSVRWRITRAVVVVVLAAVIAAIGWWSGRQTVPLAASNADEARPAVAVEVTSATVGRSLTYNVTVEQPFHVIAWNFLPGVVTSVEDLRSIDVGGAIYSVAGLPVRAVRGTLPFYRPMALGTVGDDVEQLQRTLLDLGYFRGMADGKYRESTRDAVKAWQRSDGLEATGELPLGTVASIPDLPTSVVLDEGIIPGASLAGGEEAVSVLSDTPSFSLVLQPDQAAGVPPDSAVDVMFNEFEWPATISGQEAGSDGTVTMHLKAPDGLSVCGQNCNQLPVEEFVSLRSRVHVVPEATGPGVPVASVHTSASGDPYVVQPDGAKIPVRVLASGDGIAIVEGVPIGTQVLVVEPLRSSTTEQ